ncbi:ATP synthase subunit delta, mitochondrial [Condylostylus longicornis]|uniref:ATP synthase subunit delta, mitochondrial n=1 Tax=Condylostylus longicornis TaxID=2530218 RepID=UPI00244E4578|nr:ATP synthase subunit delta, mitochondrial [Condylostylus longicornis]
MSFAMKGARMLASRSARLMQSRGYADEMKLTFAAGNKVFFDSADVRQIDVPSFSGSFGILAKHVPTLAVLKPGVVQVYQNDGKVLKVFVSSGSVSVNEDSSVQVLAEEAHLVEDLDLSQCRQLLTQYQQELGRAANDEDRAAAAIAVECCEALVKAAE